MSVPDDVMNACVSLFSGAGIGDLGIHYGCGIETIVAVEKEEDRADLIRVNYPETEVIQGDIKQKVTEIIDVSNSKLNGKRPLLISISPPCQGMSQNGISDIMLHEWFFDFEWNALLSKKLDVPIKPRVENCEDARNFLEFPEDECDADCTEWYPIL